jgi:hypothetical protein
MGFVIALVVEAVSFFAKVYKKLLYKLKTQFLKDPKINLGLLRRKDLADNTTFR